MGNNDHIRSERLEQAEHEDALTGLLQSLLVTPPLGTIIDSPPEVDLLRSLLSCNGRLTIPVLDLVAVLPGTEFRGLAGLHIASYYGDNSQDLWYIKLLENFFSSGRGSLLAIEDFNLWVGQSHLFMPPEQPSGSPRQTARHLVTHRMHFSPQQQEHKVTMKERFSEYATPLLSQFEGPAALAWICFGPGEKGSLRWGGSVFAVIQGSTPGDLQSPLLKSAVEKTYAILSAAFHRTIVDSGHREEAAQRLEDTYFAFGHELKNRLDKSGMKDLRNTIRDSVPHLLQDADDCYERLNALSGLCGVFTAVAKSDKGVLPRDWIASVNGPGGSPDYQPTENDRTDLREALTDAVAVFTYIEDTRRRLTLRYITELGTKLVSRPVSYRAVLPQFSRKTDEPHLCFLSGLAELCRNAARAALKADLTTPHVDFSVKITKGLVATVTLYNPMAGNKIVTSKSIELLTQVFGRFRNVVELVPAEEIESYQHQLTSENCYVRSRFVYSPMKLQFALVRRTA